MRGVPRSADRRPTPKDRSAHINRVISHAVNVLLADRELSRAELGDALGYTQSTISRSMQGERQWSISDLMTMAELFDVSIAQLLGESLVVRNRCHSQGEFAFAA